MEINCSTLKEAKSAVGGVKLAVKSEKSNFFLLGALQQNVLFQFFHNILQKGGVFSTKPWYPALVREKGILNEKSVEKGTRLFRSFLPFPPSKPAARAPFHLTYCTHSSKQAVVFVKYDLACFWHGNCKLVDFISHKLNWIWIFFQRFFVSPSNCHVKNLDVCYSVGDEQNSKDTTTPLIEAALSSNEKVVTYLLKHGASVNFPKVRLVISCFAFFLKVVEI